VIVLLLVLVVLLEKRKFEMRVLDKLPRMRTIQPA
jgi:hypothetical protein